MSGLIADAKTHTVERAGSILQSGKCLMAWKVLDRVLPMLPATSWVRWLWDLGIILLVFYIAIFTPLQVGGWREGPQAREGVRVRARLARASYYSYV